MSAVGVVGRRSSPSLLRRAFVSERSSSCPNLRKEGRMLKNSQLVNVLGVGSVRHLNLMLLNPRAPKIRHLNASHSLLIEMEKHVRKVQELEHKVHELEMQLQLKELVKTHAVINQAWQAEKEVQEMNEKNRTAVSEEAQKAFAERLALARKKAEQLSVKRAEEEANILRSWHQKRLRLAIDHLSQIPEDEAVKMLPQPSDVVTEQDMELNTNMLFGLETLVDFANKGATVSFQDEVDKLRQLVEERDNLIKLVEDIEAKENQTNVTVEDCRNTLWNVNAARVKLNANLKMSKTLLTTMQNVEKQRKVHNMFVFGPNPIFSSAREYEMSYSMTNEFVIEMLKELDISYLVAEKNLVSAKECRTKYQENRSQIEESLQLVQETINMQITKVNELKETSSMVDKDIPTSENNIETENKSNDIAPLGIGSQTKEI